ncbi:S-ribosylhomocysteine lyase, partial [uncultured Muribaculum sp.]
MKKIASFTVNHLTLQRGVYLSRRDALQNGEVITTFDIRMTEPNRQPALSGKSLHAIEHLAATYLRN